MGGSISASLNNNVFEIVVCFPKQKGYKTDEPALVVKKNAYKVGVLHCLFT